MNPTLLRSSEIDAIETRRAAAVSEHMPMITAISRMVDHLCELRVDLADDDRLHQVLHSVGFGWQQAEAELIATLKSHRN